VRSLGHAVAVGCTSSSRYHGLVRRRRRRRQRREMRGAKRGRGSASFTPPPEKVSEQKNETTVGIG
jgi:hypothetical protein